MAVSKITNKYGVSYQVKLRGSDGRWMTQVFRTKREALDYEVNLKRQKSLGTLVSNEAKQITVEEYFYQWFDTVQGQCTKGWRQMQKHYFLTYIKPHLGAMRLASVMPPHIAKVMTEMAKLGRAEQTRVHVYGILRKMFVDAAEVFELVHRNPVLRRLRPKLPVKEARYLNIEEVRKLLIHVEGKAYEVAVWLGVYMGLRVGEIQALRWEDVDLHQGILHVRGTYSKHDNAIKEYPKGKKQHSHRIPFELLAILKRAKAEARGKFVVQPGRYKMMEYRRYLKSLKTYCKEAGVREVATHGLRHSTSEVYMAHGATRDDLKLLFAHSSNSTTDRYIHDRGSRLEKVAEVIRLFPESSKNVPKSENQEESQTEGGALSQ